MVTNKPPAHLMEEWLKIGRADRGIGSAYDPPFGPASFHHCATLDELRDLLDYGNWGAGNAFSYQDICFISRVDGGDEWLTIRHGIAFESITWRPIIAEGRFDDLMRRLLAATPEQCRNLTY